MTGTLETRWNADAVARTLAAIGVAVPQLSESGPLREGTQGRGMVVRDPGATVVVTFVFEGPVTVTLAVVLPALATTTAKSKMDQTLFAVTVGQ
jgi:hypothetical protein